MRRLTTAVLLSASIWSVGRPAPTSAQTSIGARAASIRVGGRLQAQYQASSLDAADNDFFIRRARLGVDLTYNEFLTGKVLVDFKDGGASLLDAYAQMDFSEEFALSVGQFKRAFDLFELVSSTDLSLIERDGRVAGYDACTGVGSICSYSRLTEELAYSDRDAGVRIEGASNAVSYHATLTNGQGVGTRDENDGKSVAGRLSVAASEDVTISGNVSMHDYLSPVDETERAVAYGADVQVGTWRDGFLLQGSVVAGDNWQALDPQDQPATFLAFQAAASYYHPLDGDRFIAIEPIARLSIADPDQDTADDGGTLFTPGVMFYFTGKNKIGANVDFYTPQTGDSVYSFKVQTFLYF